MRRQTECCQVLHIVPRCETSRKCRGNADSERTVQSYDGQAFVFAHYVRPSGISIDPNGWRQYMHDRWRLECAMRARLVPAIRGPDRRTIPPGLTPQSIKIHRKVGLDSSIAPMSARIAETDTGGRDIRHNTRKKRNRPRMGFPGLGFRRHLVYPELYFVPGLILRAPRAKTHQQIKTTNTFNPPRPGYVLFPVSIAARSARSEHLCRNAFVSPLVAPCEVTSARRRHAKRLCSTGGRDRGCRSVPTGRTLFPLRALRLLFSSLLQPAPQSSPLASHRRGQAFGSRFIRCRSLALPATFVCVFFLIWGLGFRV